MLRETMKHGFSGAVWEDAKEEAKEIMIGCAKRRRTIAYSDLVSQIKSVTLDPHDIRLAHMLGEISSEEDASGRGMLTVLVVHKTADMAPGPGFYELARTLGRNTADPTRCWVAELNSVFDTWSKSGT